MNITKKIVAVVSLILLFIVLFIYTDNDWLKGVYCVVMSVVWFMSLRYGVVKFNRNLIIGLVIINSIVMLLDIFTDSDGLPILTLTVIYFIYFRKKFNSDE